MAERGASKTDAGRRKIKIRGALRDQLEQLTRGDGDAYVFARSNGGRQFEDHVRSRTLRGAVVRANDNLAERGLPPLPERLAPHSLRRTLATMLYAVGEPPPVVMAEMGHTSEGLALRIYAQAIGSGEEERSQFAELARGEKAHKGTRGDVVPITKARRKAA